MIRWKVWRNKLPGLIGIVAGEGDLPVRCARSLRSRGIRVVTVAVERPDPDIDLINASDCYSKVLLSEGAAALAAMRAEKVKHLVFCGKVPKKKIHHNGFKPDGIVRQVLKLAGAGGDERILRALSVFLQTQGICVLGVADILKEDVFAAGLLTGPAPSQEEWRDIALGYRAAREIGRLDIGQTVVVKDKAVLSVEAIEGTDAAIRRVGEMGIRGAVVVKTAKPQQCLRFDIPVVGERTLESAAAAGCRVVCGEAGRTLLAGGKETLARAAQLGLSVVGYPCRPSVNT